MIQGRAPNRRGPDRLRRPLLAILVLGVGAASLWVWAVGGLAVVASRHEWRAVALSQSFGVLVRLVGDPRDPRRAYPTAVARLLPSALSFWAIALASGLTAIGTVGVARWLWKRPARRSGGQHRSAEWAVQRQLTSLVVRSGGAGRVVLGSCGGALVAAERGHSLLVVGPTQSGKTSGLAVPAILEWEGPVLATSVKTDLVRATKDGRPGGETFVFDPSGVAGCRGSRWSPLGAASTWTGAKRLATALCAVQREGGRSPEDAAFWQTLAEKMLAPMLLAAATCGASMQDVVGWVDTGEARLVLDTLEARGSVEALRAAQASFSREERQLASVYATAEAAIGAFADPPATSDVGPDVDIGTFLDGGSHSLYLVAPTHEQERLRPVFVALLRCVLDEAFTRASRAGPLDPPLLVVLDEAANVAPPSNLDALASTAAGHGVQLVTVWQDFAQIEARYGPRSATVINNHRAKVFCSGITDRTTLDHVTALTGETRESVESVTFDPSGAASWTVSDRERHLASADTIRTLPPGEAVLLYGHLPPARLRLRVPPTGRPRQRGAPEHAKVLVTRRFHARDRS